MKNYRNFYVVGRKILENCIFLLLIPTLFGCSSLGQTYKESLATLPTQNSEDARLVFYGSNTGWYGILAGGAWNPKITINNKKVNTPNGNKIYFIIDLAPGSYSIGVEETNLLDVNIESNKTYFIEMQQYRVHEEELLTLRTFRYQLGLRKMIATFGNQMIKHMTYMKHPIITAKDAGEMIDE